MSAEAMLAKIRGQLGLGEPNFIQRWYAKRNGSAFGGNFAWCDATITWAAYETGNYDAVCFGKDYAYTVWHAQRFEKAGRWFSGTSFNVRRARPGDIVFFDWSGSNSISRIDHVGIVEKNLGGGRLQTLEGNIRNQLVREYRDSSTIAGYGRPAYAPAEPRRDYGDYYVKARYDGKYNNRVRVPWGTPTMERGRVDQDVRWLQDALNVVAGRDKLVVDGDYGPKTADAVSDYQAVVGIRGGGGEYGKRTAEALRATIKSMKEGPAPAPEPKPEPKPEPVKEDPTRTLFFPDISEWQPNADIPAILDKSWGLLAIRACYGVGYKDKRFDAYRRSATNRAKVLFIYHFVMDHGSYGGSPEENADYFARVVGRLRANEVPVIDAEAGSGNWSRSEVDRWRRRVQEKCGGRLAVVYSSESYARDHGYLALKPEMLWLAKWGAKGRDTSPPNGGNFLMWQHSGDGYGNIRVDWPSLPSTCDENRAESGYHAFIERALGKRVAPSSPPEPDRTYTDVTVDGRRVRVYDGSPYLQRGSDGAYVKWLQDMMVFSFGQRLVIDGDYGPKTESAVKSMQGKLRVAADGVYGPATAKAALAFIKARA